MPPREEKIIDGVWHWRYKGDKIWIPMSPEMMTEWIRDLQGSLSKARRELEEQKKMKQYYIFSDISKYITVFAQDNNTVLEKFPDCKIYISDGDNLSPINK